MNHPTIKSLTGNRVALLGMGKSGQSALNLLKQYESQFEILKAFDDHNPQFEPLTPQILKDYRFDTLIVSPGVPLAQVRSKIQNFPDIQLLSELDLASCFLTHEIVIGITGSVGKSTTTSLIGEVLKALDPHAFVGGNLGTPLCDYAKELQNNRAKARYIVLELSSFQIENMKHLKIDVGAITSLVPNHLERYRDKNHYFDTKLSLYHLSKGPLILNLNGGELKDYLSSKKLPFDVIWTNPDQHPEFSFHEMKLIGKYNHDNAAIALSILKYLKVDPSYFSYLKTFPGLPHRLEWVTTKNGVRYINDSKATAIQSIKESIQAVLPNTENRLHLLLGGRDKKLNWENLSDFNLNPHIKYYFFGEASSLIQSKTQLPGPQFSSLASCLEFLSQVVQKGDTVLLSPG